MFSDIFGCSDYIYIVGLLCVVAWRYSSDCFGLLLRQAVKGFWCHLVSISQFPSIKSKNSLLLPSHCRNYAVVCEAGQRHNYTSSSLLSPPPLRAHTHTHTHIHRRARARARVHTHTHVHTRTHTHTHTHTHTRTHTNACTAGDFCFRP